MTHQLGPEKSSSSLSRENGVAMGCAFALGLAIIVLTIVITVPMIAHTWVIVKDFWG